MQMKNKNISLHKTIKEISKKHIYTIMYYFSKLPMETKNGKNKFYKNREWEKLVIKYERDILLNKIHVMVWIFRLVI